MIKIIVIGIGTGTDPDDEQDQEMDDELPVRYRLDSPEQREMEFRYWLMQWQGRGEEMQKALRERGCEA